MASRWVTVESVIGRVGVCLVQRGPDGEWRARVRSPESERRPETDCYETDRAAARGSARAMVAHIDARLATPDSV